MNDKEMTPCYIGRCPKCNSPCAATVDDPKYTTHVRRDVAQFMKEGLVIERQTVKWVRENFESCTCEKKTKKKLQEQQEIDYADWEESTLKHRI